MQGNDSAEVLEGENLDGVMIISGVTAAPRPSAVGRKRRPAGPLK
jgi:hypothetical protein